MLPARSMVPQAPVFILVLMVFAVGGYLCGEGIRTFLGTPTVSAADSCNNNGTDDGPDEKCSTCPYDVQCTQTTQKCTGGDTCAATTGCEREVICGDGWVQSPEECDDGGICTGSSNALFEGVECRSLDPTGSLLAGVDRCRATGGICIAQDGDGCSWDCQRCTPNDGPCFVGSNCCGGTCTSGVCGVGGSMCGNGTADPGEECNEPLLSCPTKPATISCNNSTCLCELPIENCASYPFSLTPILSVVDADCAELNGQQVELAYDQDEFNSYYSPGVDGYAWTGTKTYAGVGGDSFKMDIILYYANTVGNIDDFTIDLTCENITAGTGQWQKDENAQLQCVDPLHADGVSDMANECGGCIDANFDIDLDW